MGAAHTSRLLRSCCARSGNSLPRDVFGFCLDCQQEIDEYDVRAAIAKEGAQS